MGVGDFPNSSSLNNKPLAALRMVYGIQKGIIADEKVNH